MAKAVGRRAKADAHLRQELADDRHRRHPLRPDGDLRPRRPRGRAVRVLPRCAPEGRPRRPLQRRRPLGRLGAGGVLPARPDGLSRRQVPRAGAAEEPVHLTLETQRRTLWLSAIALFKFVKGLVVVALGVLALSRSHYAEELAHLAGLDPRWLHAAALMA